LKKDTRPIPLCRKKLTSTLGVNTYIWKVISEKIFCNYGFCILDYPIIIFMASYNSTGKENHTSIFENIK